MQACCRMLSIMRIFLCHNNKRKTRLERTRAPNNQMETRRNNDIKLRTENFVPNMIGWTQQFPSNMPRYMPSLVDFALRRDFQAQLARVNAGNTMPAQPPQGSVMLPLLVSTHRSETTMRYTPRMCAKEGSHGRAAPKKVLVVIVN